MRRPTEKLVSFSLGKLGMTAEYVETCERKTVLLILIIKGFVGKKRNIIVINCKILLMCFVHTI